MHGNDLQYVSLRDIRYRRQGGMTKVLADEER